MAGYKRVKTIAESESGETHLFVGPEGAKVPSGKTKLTVGEVEKLTGVSAGTLRHYDKIGLLCPARAGEGVTNNRKLYSADDLGRLQAILTLAEYDFSLEEIGRILDDEDVDLYEAIAQKLIELRRRANRLRHLILFVKFTDLTDAGDTDLIEGLACGPAALDELADLARDTDAYDKAIERFEVLDDEDCAAALADLDIIMEALFTSDEACGFAEVEQVLAAFAGWWGAFVVPLEEVGYLGFWAIFEDHGLIAERVETTGNAGDASTIQMLVFFAWIAHLMKSTGASIAETARLADADVIAALEDAQELVDEFAVAMIGRSTADANAFEDLADLAFCVSLWMIGILADEELRGYLGLDDDLAFELEDIEKVARLFDVLGSED